MDPFVPIVEYWLMKLWASYTSHSSIYEAKTILEWSTMLVNGFCISVQLYGLKETIHDLVGADGSSKGNQGLN